VVVLPVKGSTPAFLISFISLFFGATSFHRQKFVYDLLIFMLVFITYYLISQLFAILGEIEIPMNVPLINSADKSSFLRGSHFTQSLYLVPGITLLVWMKHYFQQDYFKYVNYGVVLLCVYGLYEILYFILVGESGDFLSNRTFGSENDHSGSLSQVLVISGVPILRLKSLTGEPSMFAFTILPFYAYYRSTGQKKLAFLTLTCLLFSTSTAAILGLVIHHLSDLKRLFSRYYYLLNILFCLFGVVALFYFYSRFEEQVLFFVDFISRKVTLQSVSGIERFANFFNSFAYWEELNIISKLFGIGFGTIRSTDLLSTLLVNLGMICLGSIFIYMIYLILKLRVNSEGKGLSNALIQILVISMISVSEFSYLSIWFFVGAAIVHLKKESN
jgi:hypothetical protein